MTLRVRRGSQDEYNARVLADEASFEPGEPVWVADNKLYIGDGTNGGVLVNPSISVDPESETVVGVTTVVVERSRSIYESDNNEINLGAGNNFRVTAADGAITFINPSDGQSGYLLVVVAGAGGATLTSTAGVAVVYAPDAVNALLGTGEHFVSYTVVKLALEPAHRVYISSTDVTAQP